MKRIFFVLNRNWQLPFSCGRINTQNPIFRRNDPGRASHRGGTRSDFMNIATFSPILALLYVFALLSILMGVDPKSFNRTQRWLVPLFAILLCVVNQLLRNWLGPAVYGKLLIFSMHLPTFLLFLYITKRGVIKTVFMIFTAIVFTAPTVLIGNLVRRTLFKGQPMALLLANLISYSLMLLLAYFVFRSPFNYLLLYGDDQFFLLFSYKTICKGFGLDRTEFI